MKYWVIILILVGWIPNELIATSCAVGNETLSVEFDDVTGTFQAVEKATATPFLVNGQLEGGAKKATADLANDPVFGKGRRIIVTQTDGSVVNLEVYNHLPFLLVRKELHNNGVVVTDYQKQDPVTFELDLGKPPTKLRTMGTAGLTAPDANPGSYLFLTLADPETRRGVVTGWLTEDRGSGVIFSSLKDGHTEFKAQIDYGHLHIRAGRSEKLETLAIGVFEDARLGEEAYADAIKEQYHIKLHPQVAGYCTWYSEVGGLTDKEGGGGCSNEKNITALAKYASEELKPYGFSFVQIDDGWQGGGVFNGPKRGFTRAAPNGAYPHGMKPIADTIKSDDLTAGIWFIPFARNYQDPEYKDRQSWFMKRLDGRPYETVWGGTSLDLTRPDVQEHIINLARTIHGWGYNYFKLDGLWTGSVTEQQYVNDGYKDDAIGNYQSFYDSNETSIEALRDGLKLLRKGAGPTVFFSGCCASQNMRSLGGSIGLVDSMRIGPDNGFGWEDYHKEVIHPDGGGIITGPIRGDRLYFLNGRVWWNDPDPAYVRGNVKLNHAQLLASWMALGGMFNLDSDWLPGLSPERLDILKRCMLPYRAVARPADYFDTAMPEIWLTTDASQPVRRDVLGLYNWDSEGKNITYDAAKAGLDATKTYYAFDFWNKSPLPTFKGTFTFAVPAESCRVIAVRAAEDHPVLVSTSQHVTQGIADVKNEKWNPSAGTLSATSQIVGNDPYEIRIAGIGNDSSEWEFVSASISTKSTVIAPEPSASRESGWLRVLISSKTSRTVRWTLKFERRPPFPMLSQNGAGAMHQP